MFLHVIFNSNDSLDLEVKYVSLINDSKGSCLYYELLFDNPEEGDTFPISDVFYFSITAQEFEDHEVLEKRLYKASKVLTDYVDSIINREEK